MAVNMSETSQLGWRMLTYAASAAVLVFLRAADESKHGRSVFICDCAMFVPYRHLRVDLRNHSEKAANRCDGRDILDRLSAAICLQLPNTHFHEMVLWSGRYKDKVLAQPASINGGLKHIEWDGWGWGGQDFSVFLVFDPPDSLSGPAKSRQSGKRNGIPCEVSSVRRMDSHWYIVFFDGYVDQSSWDSCK